MHTPLTISTTCDHRPAIADARGINIASWDPATIELFDDVRPDIVKAVNSYEVMREALIAARSSLYNVPEVGKRYDQQHSDTHMRACLAIDRALALAEGKE